MIDAEVKEPELDGEYVDEILEDLADEAATNRSPPSLSFTLFPSSFPFRCPSLTSISLISLFLFEYSYLAPSEAESLRGEHSIIDKLKLGLFLSLSFTHPFFDSKIPFSSFFFR